MAARPFDPALPVDEQLALAIAMSEERAVREENDRDRASRTLAWQLEMKEQAKNKAHSQAPWKNGFKGAEVKILDTETETLEKLSTEPPMTCRLDTDAHAYTASHIRPGCPKVIALDDKYKLSNPALTIDQIKTEMLTELKEAESKDTSLETNLNAMFDKLKANGATADAETTINPIEILSRTWSLAKEFGRGEMMKLILAFSDNIQFKGGCMAGHVARTYPCYVTLVKACFLRAKEQVAIDQSLREQEKPSEDQQFAWAMAESKRQAEAHNNRGVDTSQDEAIARALSLS